jgi:hypothetical protein
MGYRDPSAEAAMRAVKAEGGWAVVCTEETEIGPSSVISAGQQVVELVLEQLGRVEVHAGEVTG